jgi:hypothetical protein
LNEAMFRLLARAFLSRTKGTVPRRTPYRDVATADEARLIYGIGEQYKTVDARCRSLANLIARKPPVANFCSWPNSALNQIVPTTPTR